MVPSHVSQTSRSSARTKQMPASQTAIDLECAVFLRRAVAAEPLNADNRRKLGIALREAGFVDEAVEHLEIAIALSRRRWIEHTLRNEHPALVARPDSNTEIYRYRQYFYVVTRGTGSVQVSAIAGELFDIRNNSSYHFIRWVLRSYFIRRLASALKRPVAGDPSMTTSTEIKGTLRRELRILIGFALRCVARATFARTIGMRAITFEEAFAMAQRQIDHG